MRRWLPILAFVALTCNLPGCAAPAQQTTQEIAPASQIVVLVENYSWTDFVVYHEGRRVGRAAGQKETRIEIPRLETTPLTLIFESRLEGVRLTLSENFHPDVRVVYVRLQSNIGTSHFRI